MKQTLLIAKRDFKMYFASPIAYQLMAVFTLITGWMFFSTLSYFVGQQQQFAMMSFGNKPTLADTVLRPLFGNMNVVLLFIVPAITMRLLAEERKDHTVELLFTAPITPLQIIWGKFLSAFGLVCVMLVPTVIYPVVLMITGKPDVSVIIGCYLGLLFIVASYISVGLFWSAITENQIIAFCLSFGTLLFFWLISWAAYGAGPFWSDVLNHLSIIGHYTNFSQGVIDSVDIVYYLSFIGLGVFLSYLSFDSNQWG